MAGIFDSGGGGDSAMTVSILGDAAGATAAATQAANALAQLGPAAEEAATQANAALSQIGPAMQGVAGATDDAMGGMGDSMAGMAVMAQESFTGASGLAGTVQIANDSVQKTLGSGPSGLMGFFSSVGQGIGQAADGISSFAGKVMSAVNPLNIFHSSITKMLEVMAGWRLMEGGIQAVGNFVGGIWQLPIQMEKAQGSWQYMFNPDRTAGQSLTQWQQQGQGIAQGISTWTQKESINLPYTRQDLISAITSLAPAGLSAQGIEKYLPIIGDIAAAQNPNLSLQQASYSIMGAMMGYSRMLRYDLHINPDQLTQYGYNTANNATLLPALEKYAEARGITSYNAQGQDTGAAYNISHTTFWGEWSSFIDRIQNTQILTGDQGPFGQLKGGLTWLNGWIDDHSGQIDKFATMLGETLAGGMKAAGDAASGLFAGLKQSGVVDDLSNAFAGFAKWMSDPNTQKGIQTLFSEIGKPLGTDLKGMGSMISGVAQGFGGFWQGLGPQGQTALLWLAGVPGDMMSYTGSWLGMAGSVLGNTAGAFGSAVTGDWKGVTTHVGNALHSMGNWGADMAAGVENWAGYGGLAKATPTIFNSIWNQLARQAGSATQDASNVIGNVAHGIGSGVQAVGTAGVNAWGNMGAMWNWATGKGWNGTAGQPAQAQQNQPQGQGESSILGAIHQVVNQAQTAVGQAQIAAFVALDRKQKGAGSLTPQQEAEQEKQAVVKSHEQMEKEVAAHTAEMVQQVATQTMRMKQTVLARMEEMREGSTKSAQQLQQGLTAHLTGMAADGAREAKALHDKFLPQIDQLVSGTTQRLKSMRGQSDDILSGMATAAGQWGANLVDELTAGMTGKTPEARRAAVALARTLQANLGFGSPTEEGPGSTADRWAPNFIRMFNAGLLQGVPQIMRTAAAIASAMNPVTASGVGSAVSTAYNTAYGATNTAFHLYGLPPSAVQQVVTQALQQSDARGNRALRRPGNYGRIGWIGG